MEYRGFEIVDVSISMDGACIGGIHHVVGLLQIALYSGADLTYLTARPIADELD